MTPNTPPPLVLVLVLLAAWGFDEAGGGPGGRFEGRGGGGAGAFLPGAAFGGGGLGARTGGLGLGLVVPAMAAASGLGLVLGLATSGGCSGCVEPTTLSPVLAGGVGAAAAATAGLTAAALLLSAVPHRSSASNAKASSSLPPPLPLPSSLSLSLNHFLGPPNPAAPTPNTFKSAVLNSGCAELSSESPLAGAVSAPDSSPRTLAREPNPNLLKKPRPLIVYRLWQTHQAQRPAAKRGRRSQTGKHSQPAVTQPVLCNVHGAGTRSRAQYRARRHGQLFHEPQLSTHDCWRQRDAT